MTLQADTVELFMMLTPEEIGHSIKKHRLAAGVNQETLSAAAGISTAYVSRIESGQRKPTVRVLEGICKTLDVPADTLLSQTAAPRPIDLEETLRVTLRLIEMLPRDAPERLRMETRIIGFAAKAADRIINQP